MLLCCKPSRKGNKSFPIKWEFHPMNWELCVIWQALTNTWHCVSIHFFIQYQYLSTKSGTMAAKLDYFEPVVSLVVKFVSPVFHPMVINNTTCLQRFCCLWPSCNASSIGGSSFWISQSVKFTSVKIYYNEIVAQQLINIYSRLQPLFINASTFEPAPIDISKLTKPVGHCLIYIYRIDIL